MIPENNKSVPFGFKNYLRMFRSKGIKLPVYYFFQAHLYDLIHGVDTHKWLPKTYLESDAALNKNEYYIYMASWTCEIKNIFEKIKSYLGKNFSEYTFIDIGCGKGKVPIVWNQCCINQKNKSANLWD